MTAAAVGAAAVILDHVWVGAGIHIHTGAPAEAREPFLPWRDLPDDPDAVFALLSWHARLTPLTGRDKDKDTLLQWARQGRNARIRLLSGPGGVGKSRLAAEVADALRAEGWTAGFIRPNDPIVVPLRRAGLFLVVDYPEEHPDEVRTLLREVASRELRDVPVRLLVLSRARRGSVVRSRRKRARRRADGRARDRLERIGGGRARDALLRSAAPLGRHYRRPMPAIPRKLCAVGLRSTLGCMDYRCFWPRLPYTHSQIQRLPSVSAERPLFKPWRTESRRDSTMPGTPRGLGRAGASRIVASGYRARIGRRLFVAAVGRPSA